MRLKRGNGGVRRGLLGEDLFRMSGSSMEALAASRSSRSSSEERPRSTPPRVDTARSWLAAAACSGYSFFTWLPVVCSAVLYAGYMDQYPEVARRDASWPFTIMLVVINVGGKQVRYSRKKIVKKILACEGRYPSLPLRMASMWAKARLHIARRLAIERSN
ncbi:uncharacterized protein LOC125943059 [Dermacentor silvarum]|uniref:uncharacterized protein LOC125943059 n=1 Tax=Dermacentor silvarum TaxID=543639 RepID=UPI002100B293|nr:uncharacterized protein LOC125943059 [Dermacentor silvarum]